MKHSKIGTDIALASEYILDGKLVSMPTETVYGLAADATNPNAVAAIFEAKNRPNFDPLIVHIYSINQLELICEAKTIEIEFAEKFWPGPLTLILKKKDSIPFIVTSGLDTVGVRMPNHAFALSLLKSCNKPLAAPSANPFGYVSPTSAQHVFDQLGGKVDYILDGGISKVGIESTIVKVEEKGFHVLRLGGLSVETLEEVSGFRCLSIQTGSSKPEAPGMLDSHYSPTPKVVLYDLDDNDFSPKSKTFGVLTFGETPHWSKAGTEYSLSKKSDLNEAAVNLFAGLRALDLPNLDTIYAPILPNIDLGRAINDRLKRASF